MTGSDICKKLLPAFLAAAVAATAGAEAAVSDALPTLADIRNRNLLETADFGYRVQAPAVTTLAISNPVASRATVNRAPQLSLPQKPEDINFGSINLDHASTTAIAASGGIHNDAPAADAPGAPTFDKNLAAYIDAVDPTDPNVLTNPVPGAGLLFLTGAAAAGWRLRRKSRPATA